MLKLSKNSQLTDVISNDGSNPLTTQHPIEGSTAKVQVWLFNDNNKKRYEQAKVESTGLDSSWVQVSLTENGTYASSLAMGNINNSLGHPLWVRVTTPTVSDTQNKTSINLTVTGTEFAV